MNTSKSQNGNRTQFIVVLVMAVLILVPSMVGFVNKFREFIVTTQDGQEGIFALTPIINYLLASMGFFCLLCWAITHGMFRNIERPKEVFLETEAMLDHHEPLEEIRERRAELNRLR